MAEKPTYEELELRISELETENKNLVEDVSFLKAIAETAHAIILVLDTKGQIVYLNPYMEEISNYKLEEVKDKDWFSTFLPDQDQDKTRTLFQNSISDIHTKGNINSIIAKDGHKILVEWYDKTLKDEDGNTLGLLAIGQDATERKQSEDALHESISRLRSYHDQKLVGVAITSLEKGFVDGNDRFFEILGHSREELKNKTWAEITHPDDLAADVEQFNRMLKQEIENYSMEKRFIQSDGKIVFTRIFVSCEKDQNGTVRDIVVLIENVSEGKIAEKKLRRISYDLKERVKELNCLYDISKIAAQPDISIDEKLLGIANRIPAAFQFPEHTCTRIIVWDKEYKTSNFQLTSSKISDEIIVHGSRVGRLETCCLDDNITYSENVFAKEEVFLLNAIAEQLTNFIEHIEMDEKLRINQDQLRSLSFELLLTEERERRQIATDLHDRIGQALAISKIKINALNSLSALENLPKSVNQIVEIIDQIIQDTRTLTFEISPPILYELGFESAVQWLIEQFNEKHDIFFEYEDDGQPKPIHSSALVLLFRATQELLYNIIKHSQAEKAKISIRRDDKNLKITVSDNGVGFNMMEISTHVSEHQSFGLFSIRERLTQLDGRLEIKSETGKGSSFTLIAPLSLD